jgi:iron complex outermembrane receptor protein
MSNSRCLVSVSSAALVVTGMMLTIPRVGWAQIEEIVVTTRKKTESLQDVPIAVDAFSSEMLQRQGVKNLANLTQLSPSVQFDQSYGPADVRIGIRGLSNTRGRSNVAFLVDGVDVTTENFVSAGSGLLANQRLLADVERIEIVKGPQSALFGRSAFAGAISYTTKEPGDEFEAQVRAEVAEYGVYQLDGSVGGPVVGLEDVLGLRLTGTYWTGDGFFTNTASGEPLNDEEGFGLAATMVWTPADEAKIKLRTEYTDSQFGQQAVVRVGGGHHVVAHNPRDASDPNFTGHPADNLQKFYPYPTNAITPDPNHFNQIPLGEGSFIGTGLSNFGQYCPKGLQDDSGVKGICAPPSFGNASDYPGPAFSENPLTGKDFPGTETTLFRVSLNASIDYELGSFSSITGWNDYEAFSAIDQDYTAVGRPDTLVTHQTGESELTTSQFSQELRFQSELEGPANFTLGALFWTEDRQQADTNSITSCVEYGKTPAGEVWPNTAALFLDPGICDGTVADPTIPQRTVSSWQEQYIQLRPCQYDANGNPIVDPNDPAGHCLQESRTPQPWQAQTDHWSVYFNTDFDVAENWNLLLENRTVWEEFYSLRPSKSGCGVLGFPLGTDTSAADWVAELPVSNVNFQDIACVSEQQMNPNIGTSLDMQGQWFLIEGTTSSYYNTPKVTLTWDATDDSMVYFSWGKGQKPGGINQVSAGGSPTNIRDERFLPEIVQAWEVGAKTSWEAGGFLQWNSAAFLNDYTDKQVGTQIQTSGGFTQPRVINAASAQVWGLELEVNWQPKWVEGLLVNAAYTWLEPIFKDFQDTTRSLQRAAVAEQGCDLVYRPKDTLTDVPAGGDPTDDAYCTLDLSGNNLERVPENAFVGGIDFTRQFFSTEADYFVGATASYEDERFADADNFLAWDAYWLVDLRAGLNSDQWELQVYVKNLLDDDTIRTGGNGPDFGAQVGELGFTAGFGTTHWFGILPNPQQFGAMFTYHF